MLRLTRAQVREIDRLSIEQYHIPGIVLMENAARAAADVASEMLGRSPRPPDPHPLRRRQQRRRRPGRRPAPSQPRRQVSIALTIDPAKYQGRCPDQLADHFRDEPPLPAAADPRRNRTDPGRSADRRHFRHRPPDAAPGSVPCAGRSRRSQAARPVLAIDLPSGLDCDTGQPARRLPSAPPAPSPSSPKKSALHRRQLLGAARHQSLGIDRSQRVDRRRTPGSWRSLKRSTRRREMHFNQQRRNLTIAPKPSHNPAPRRIASPQTPPSSSGLGYLILSQRTGVRLPLGQSVTGKPLQAKESPGISGVFSAWVHPTNCCPSLAVSDARCAGFLRRPAPGCPSIAFSKWASVVCR